MSDGNGKTRQMSRAEQREKEKQEESMRKTLNSPVKQSEFQMTMSGVQQNFDTLKKEFLRLEFSIRAFNATLVKKGLCTEEELTQAFYYEQKKFNAYIDVESSDKPVEEKLQLCREYAIPISVTVIEAIKKSDLTEERRQELADEFKFSYDMVSNAVKVEAVQA